MGTAAGEGGSMSMMNPQMPEAALEDFDKEMAKRPSPMSRIMEGFDAIKKQRSEMAPTDRIKAAFDAMRSSPQMEMPDASGVYGPNATLGVNVMPGLVKEPVRPPMNLAAHGVVTVPDRVRPAVEQAPETDTSPMGFFMRNALAQQDRESGQYLNPEAAKKAMASSPFSGLFG